MNRILTEERIAVIEKGLFMALVSLCVSIFFSAVGSRFEVVTSFRFDTVGSKPTWSVLRQRSCFKE